ncbi:MAG TPA: hypothetical protein DEQ80_06135 [Anaerolinea thermolimosa]|uniref:Uncharacterized protein n=1 Tax=Anaerolinea thermolimosa TaxID=229919 RepID=A0A3D1JFR1_9CHLR|nr:hypothetical protein [Anaerolinea thermolimosa]GAP08593.1 hypothetical protein ATHL_03498 [Anaerolinea thermolimosa]HCE17419.1 hypothetical protein [Anaerolinea thermolimosa]
MEAILKSAAASQDAIVQTRQGGLNFHRPSHPISIALSKAGQVLIAAPVLLTLSPGQAFTAR